MENHEKPRLLKIQEVCTLLNLSRSMVYRLTGSNDLASVHIGKSVRIPATAVETYLESLTQPEKVA